MTEPRKSLGEHLLEAGAVSREALDFALQEQEITGEPLGEVLERNGFVTQYEVARAMASQYNLPYMDVDEVQPQTDALRLFNLNLCKTHHFLPIGREGETIKVATSNNDIGTLRDIVARHSGLKVDIYQGEHHKIRKAIQHYYYFLFNPIEELLQHEIAQATADQNSVRTLDSLLINIFRLAIKHRSSDIHIRPMERSINVAFRIDGIMRTMFCLRLELRRLIPTVKIRANMNIAEQRLPQDGSFSLVINDGDYDIRVSTTVCTFGENLVMRVLSRDYEAIGLKQLGFLDEDIPLLHRIFQSPYGIVLLTGPTGSGKTTTLHAGVRTQDILTKNIITVEDPIEYKLPIVRQTEVNEKAGYTFASAIRHFLRHDPDTIIVGEIRDSETAKTAITSAETGHLVVSTLHTNNVFGVIPRLRAFGIPPHMLADSLVGVVSQRLVRKVCVHCKEEYEASELERTYLNTEGPVTLHRGKGCEACYDSGYLGREPIYEILLVDNKLSAAISRDENSARLAEIAKESGFKSMFETAVKKALRGTTTLAEVMRMVPSS